MRKSFLVFLILVLVFLPCGCQNTLTTRNYVFYDYFGSACTLYLTDYSGSAGTKKFNETVEAINGILSDIDSAISLSNIESDINKFNALSSGQSITVSDTTAEIIGIAKQAYADTNGAYDPTVYLSCDLWGLTSRFFTSSYQSTTAYDRDISSYDTALPNQEYITAFASLIDFSAVRLTQLESGYTLTKTAQGVNIGNVTYYQQLDLGGVGKGYAVDKVIAYVKAQGYEYGYFSCGQSSVGLLSNAKTDGNYSVQIRNPRNQLNNYAIYENEKCSLSTSGDYERCHTINGIYYSHIINTSNGTPINPPISASQKGVCSISVFGQSAAYCDCISTALCADYQKAIDFFNLHGEFSYIMVLYENGNESYEVVTNIINGLTLSNGFSTACTVEGGKVTYNGNLMTD